MAFVARGDQHAIVEAGFGLRLARPWLPPEIERLAQNHDRWKDDLPRLARNEVNQILVGELQRQAIAMPGIALPGVDGIVFERIKPDGELAWRLGCQGDLIVVNCLEYTRWDDVWPTTSQHMKSALEVTGIDKMSIAGGFLQYIDIFDWDGPDNEYDIFQLMDRKSPYVPEKIDEFGSVWHLHQGWFKEVQSPIAARILQKIHFAGLPGAVPGKPMVKIDTLVRADFASHVPAMNTFAHGSSITGIFDLMHGMCKELLRSFLNESTCEAIRLEQG